MYFRIDVFKNVAMFIGKHLCWSLFSINIQTSRPLTLLKRDSNKSFSCESCKIFKNTFFYRTRQVASSRNISWTLSLLHFRTMNGVISWYVLAVQRLFHFIVCVSFLSISFFFFLFFFADSTAFWFWSKFANT